KSSSEYTVFDAQLYSSSPMYSLPLNKLATAAILRVLAHALEQRVRLSESPSSRNLFSRSTHLSASSKYFSSNLIFFISRSESNGWTFRQSLTRFPTLLKVSSENFANLFLFK